MTSKNAQFKFEHVHQFSLLFSLALAHVRLLAFACVDLDAIFIFIYIFIRHFRRFSFRFLLFSFCPLNIQIISCDFYISSLLQRTWSLAINKSSLSLNEEKVSMPHLIDSLHLILSSFFIAFTHLKFVLIFLSLFSAVRFGSVLFYACIQWCYYYTLYTMCCVCISTFN